MESIDDRGMHDGDGATGDNKYALIPDNLMPDTDTTATLINGKRKHFWNKAASWVTDNTFAPGWLSGKWASPAIGYVTAVILQIAAIFIVTTLLHIFPIFHFQAALVVLVILVIALNWGVGPSLLATMAGAILLIFFVIQPYFSFSLTARGDTVGLVIYLIVGLAVSILAAQTEHARRHAEALRLRLETTFEAMTDGVNVYDRHGFVLSMNHAYRDFIALDTDTHPEHLTLSALERGNQLLVRDEQGHPLPDEQRPVSRMLKGEVLTGENAMDIRLRALDGRELQLNISGSPLRDQSGEINGGILIFRDVTERRRLERRTQEALKALLEMAEVLVSSEAIPEHEQAEAATQKMAQRLAALICRVLDCQASTIIVLDAAKNALQLLAASGLSATQQDQTATWIQHIRLNNELRGSPIVAQLRMGNRVAD